MNESKGTMESVTLSRVPDEQRKNWWTVALIQAGIMISIPCLYGRIHAGIQPINW